MPTRSATEPIVQAHAPATVLAQPTPLSAARRYDIDALRVLAMLGVFLFHNARFFDSLPWHLKNAERSIVALVFVGLLNCFQMPLLMLVSGAASYFALRWRTPGQYLVDRAKRLLVPLYTVGFFILIPPQFYWELATNHAFRGSFVESIPYYLRTLHMGLDLRLLAYWSGHLWFLHSLFVISLLTLPVLWFLNRDRGRRVLSGLALWLNRPGGILLLFLPIAAVRIGLSALLGPGHGLVELFSYMSFFLIGFGLMANPRFTCAIRRHTAASLILAALSFLALAGWVFGFDYRFWLVESFDGAHALFLLVASLNTWCFLAGFLGLAHRFLNRPSPALARANQAVLPFYILHQTLILAVGWFVIRLSLPVAAKYPLIAALSFLLILLIYRVLIRPSNAVRFLFGMRPRPAPLATAVA